MVVVVGESHKVVVVVSGRQGNSDGGECETR